MKKWGTALLLAVLMIAQISQPLSVLAQEVTKQSETATVSSDVEGDTESSSEVQNPEVDFSNPLSSELENQSGEKQQAEVEDENSVQPAIEPVITEEVISNSNATFAGQSLTENNAVSYTWSELMGTERFNKKLSINGKFDPRPLSGKKITIKLSEEFQYASLPGFKLVSGKLVFDASTLPKQLSTVITNGTIDYPTVYSTVMGSSGTVSYELANATVEVNMEVMLGVSTNFIINENGRDYTNPIQVIYSEENNVDFYDQTFEKISLSPGNSIVPRFYLTSASRFTSVYQSTTGTFKTGTGFFMTTGGQPIESVGAFLDVISYEVRYDKRLDLKSVYFQKVQSTSIQELPEKEDATYKYAIVTANEVLATGPVYYNVAFSAGVNPASIPVDTKLNIVSTGKVSYQARNRDMVTDATLAAGIDVGVIIIKDFENKLTSQALATSISKNNASAYSYLGSFGIENQQPQAVTDQKFQANFDTSKVNVQAMRIATIGGKTANIKITTTTGRVVNVPNNSSTNIAQQLLDLANHGQQPGEFIAAVEWTDDVPANYRTQTALHSADKIRYYGLLKDDLTVGEQITTNELKYGSMTTFDTTNETVKSIINVQNYKNFSGAIQSTSTTILSGTKSNIVLGVRVREDAPGGAISGLKGLTIYVRELEGMTVIPNDFKAIDSGNRAFTVADGNVEVTKILDNTGTTVYKFTMPDYDLNSAIPTKVRTEAINIGIYSDKTSSTTSYSLADIVFMEPGDTDIAVLNNSVLNGTSLNKYGLGSKPESAYILTALPAATLNIQASVDFNVTTSANLNGGPFVSYTGTADTIINLNPDGEAQYGLKVLNNSGQTVNGYQAIIPIPKRGETTNRAYQLQEDDFGWTVQLEEPLDLSHNNYDYTVLYATNYELDFNSTNWKTWDEISDKKEIRAIYIQTNDSIVSVENATADNPGEDFIAFNIDMDLATADQDAGNTNIYKALIRRELDGVVSNVPSEAVAIRLKTGVVKGQVFNDLNRDGTLNANETGVNGVNVTAYKKGTTDVIDSTTSKTVNGVDGCYAFFGLDKEQEVDVVFDNVVSDDSMRFVNAAGVNISSDRMKATIANVTASSAGSDQISIGMMTPIKVTYDAQGGTSSVAEEFIGYPDSKLKATSSPTATKLGYSLDGWYTETEGGSKVSFPYEVIGNADITLYAHYNAIPYDLTLNVEGVETVISVPYQSLITKPADPNKTGYTFIGWYDAATGGTKWDFATDKMPANDMTLYARFEVRKFDLTFNNDGVTNVQEVTYDTLVTEPVAPSKTGYTFVGWYDAAAGGTKWNFAIDKMPATNLILYARYNINSYLVTFNDQGNLTTQSVNYNELVTAPTEPTKTDYLFVGWKEQTSGKNWNFTVDRMPANNLNLVAQFVGEDQTITFDVNGGVESSKPADIIQPLASDVHIDELEAPVYPGYAFVGWFDGNTQVSGTIVMPKNGLNLVAHWTATDQVVRFNTNGGTGVASITTPTDSTVDIDAQLTTRAGYTFAGWHDAAGNLVSGMVTVPAGGLNLTAHWIADNQTITFDINGGDPATHPLDVIQPTDSIVNIAAVIVPERAGFEFAGWYDAAGNLVSGTINMPVGGLNLVAHWDDLIANGTWILDGNDFEISLDELKELDASGKLDEEVRKRSSARVWNQNTGNDVDDASNIHINVKDMAYQAGQYTVELSYGPTTYQAPTTKADNPANEPSKLENKVTMTVTDTTVDPKTDETPIKVSKKPTKVKLPSTGEAYLKDAWICGIILLSFGVLLYARKNKKYLR